MDIFPQECILQDNSEKKCEQLKSIEKFAAYSYEINIPVFKQEKVHEYYEKIEKRIKKKLKLK